MTVETRLPAGRSSPPPPARQRRRRGAGAGTPPWWFAAPALAVYALVVLYPSIAGVGYAFTNWSGVGEQTSFVGLRNFRTLFHDEQAVR